MVSKNARKDEFVDGVRVIRKLETCAMEAVQLALARAKDGGFADVYPYTGEATTMLVGDETLIKVKYEATVQFEPKATTRRF